MRTKILSLAAWIFLLAGCAGMESGGGGGSAPVPYPPPGMDHRVGNSHLELFWRCARPEPGVLRLDGLVANYNNAQPIRFFEAELVGVDAGGRDRSAARGEARDQSISTAQMSPFDISLKEGGDEVRFDLYYKYDYYELDQHAQIASSAGAAPSVVVSNQHLVARDVCNPGQHRMR